VLSKKSDNESVGSFNNQLISRPRISNSPSNSHNSKKIEKIEKIENPFSRHKLPSVKDTSVAKFINYITRHEIEHKSFEKKKGLDLKDTLIYNDGMH
jgi:hypothetical protein